MDEKFLTAPEVGKMLGVTSACVNRWLDAGEFPGAYRCNPNLKKSRWRIPRGDVELFVEKRRKQRGYFYVPVAPRV
jgi:predicted DNA-binding transcriptional regulator AlpA